MEVFQSCGVVALRDVWLGGYGGKGLGLELVILVLSSNLNGSMTCWRM